VPDPADQILATGAAPEHAPTTNGTPRAFAARVWDALLPRIDDSEFMSETSAAAMRGAPARVHWILLASLAFVVVALGWAAWAEIDEITVGQGQVIPSSKI